MGRKACATRAISLDFSYWIGIWTPWRLDDISLGLEAVGLSDTIGFASAVDLRKHPKRLEETAILVF